MKTSDASVLIVPGYKGSGPDHWQSRWEAKLSAAHRVEQKDWETPHLRDWIDTLVTAVNRAEKPVILVPHSLGVAAVIRAVSNFQTGKVVGAYMVGLPDVESITHVPAALQHFGPLPTDPLPFPSRLIASRNDPYCAFARAEHFAHAWGSHFQDAGEVGHINEESGHGPWPEGLLSFARFTSHLG
ncbi:MAG: alpha/beta hydrolase [Stappiaceae bacterium]